MIWLRTEDLFMSKINIFALGGLNESGKNMYVVEIDKDIFIFDAGLKYADDKMLGVDYILPDYSYITTNKSRVKGVFLSHGHDEQIGAVSDILRENKGLKIYGTKYTLDVLREDLKEDGISDDSLVLIEPHVKIKVGRTFMFPIRLSHAVADTVGYVLYTKHGSIVYTGNFVFDPMMKGSYKTDIGKLAYVGKQGVLCLLSESTYADKLGFTSPNHRCYSFFKDLLYKNERRVLINVYLGDNYRIQEILNAVTDMDRKVVILGKRLENSIFSSIENNYLDFDRSRISNIHKIKDNNVVVLISDEREKPFSNLKRIVKGYDKFITLSKEDTVCFASLVFDGMERSASNLFDNIAKLGCNLVLMSGKRHPLLHASSEDLMMMLDLMQPKYYFPVIGEYRQMVANANVAFQLGYNESNVILSLNGEIATFNNGELSNTKKSIKVDDILIDGKTVGDVGELVIRDREMLGESGIVLITLLLDKKTKELINEPDIVTKGFVYMSDSSELLSKASDICRDIVIENCKPTYADYAKIKKNIRDKVGKYLYSETESKPVILIIVQEI